MGFPKNSTLLTATTTANSPWVFTGDSARISLDIQNIEVGGKILVRGSNKEARPGAADLEAKANEDFINAGTAAVDFLYEHKPGFRWLLARKEQGGSPVETTVELQEWVDT